MLALLITLHALYAGVVLRVHQARLCETIIRAFMQQPCSCRPVVKVDPTHQVMSNLLLLALYSATHAITWHVPAYRGLPDGCES